MEFLQRLDWLNHDGVNLAMLNDAVRNHFYNDAIRHSVRDKHCIEIGFGTGLLSVLALQHGARHITAFESDQDRYELGLLVLDRLKLHNKVTLHNSRFCRDTCTDFSDIIIHEVLAPNLWGERLWYSLGAPVSWLPRDVMVDIHCIPVSNRLAENLQGACQDHCFDPGVDITESFVTLINDVMRIKSGSPVCEIIRSAVMPGFTSFDEGQQTLHGYHAHMRMIDSCDLAAGYRIDCTARQLHRLDHGVWSTQDLDLNMLDIQLNLELDQDRSRTWLIVPTVSVQHGGRRLRLDRASWGPTQQARIAHRVSNVTVTHSFETGRFDYGAEDV